MLISVTISTTCGVVLKYTFPPISAYVHLARLLFVCSIIGNSVWHFDRRDSRFFGADVAVDGCVIQSGSLAMGLVER
jgi:hypothetical protein